MMDQRRQQLIEQYEDAALSLLMDEYANEEGERLLKEFEEAKKNGDLLEMPAELDTKCRKLIDQTFAKMERMERLKRIGRSVAKAAVVTLVLLGTLSTMVMSVEAFRVPVLNFLYDESGRYGSVKTEGDDEHSDTIDFDVVAAFESCIPSGFVKVQSDIADDRCSLCYINENDQNVIICFDMVPTSDELIVDTEDIDFIPVEINGHNATLDKKDGYQLMWVDQQGQFFCTLYVRGFSESMFWEFVYSIII